MTIQTKFNLGDKCLFLINNKIHESKIVHVEVREGYGHSSVRYTIDKNPAGSHYTVMFDEDNLILTKNETP